MELPEPLLRARQRLAPYAARVRGSYLDVRSAFLIRRGNDRVALASFPRSGNTWLRALIEHATGERTGSVYSDNVLRRPSEGIVIKTHERDRHRYTAAVHLLRNPFDAIDSFYDWQRDIRRVDRAWADVVRDTSRWWVGLNTHWLDFPGPRIEAWYEHLREDPAAELAHVLNLLGRDVPSDRIEHAVEQTRLDKLRRSNGRVGERFFRRGTSGQGIDRFTTEQREHVLRLIEPLWARFERPPTIDHISNEGVPA